MDILWINDKLLSKVGGTEDCLGSNSAFMFDPENP